MSSIDKLRTLIGEVMDLRHAADLIEWDERVYMPPGGAAVHGEMSAALRRLAMYVCSVLYIASRMYDMFVTTLNAPYGSSPSRRTGRFEIAPQGRAPGA